MSELCKNLNSIIEAQANRPLSDDQYPFLLVDAPPNSLKDEVHSRVRAILEAPDEETARELLHKTTSFYEDEVPKAISILEAGFYHAAAVLSLP